MAGGVGSEAARGGEAPGLVGGGCGGGADGRSGGLGGDEWVLLAAFGNKWLRDEVIDGKRFKVDGFASIYANLKGRLKEQGVDL